MSHTKGPWRVHDGWQTCIVAGEPDDRRDGPFKYVIATCSKHDSHRLPESEANARLIAAAPELLEFCKRVAYRYRVFCNGLVSPEMYADYREAIDLINKATGAQEDGQ